MQYSIGALSHATGVPVNTLRTWERRYGVPRPDRTRSGWRVYGEDDLLVVRRMLALHRAGMPAALAAESAHLGATDSAGGPNPEPPPLPPEATELLSLSEAFDEDSVVSLVRSLVKERGWGDALVNVVFPALVAVGAAWSRGELSLAHEHFLSHLIERELHSALSALEPAPVGGRRVLLACPDGEHHSLGTLALTLLLRQRGAACIYLGAAVPPRDVALAARAVRCDIVCVTAVVPTSLPQLGLTGRALIADRTPARFFVGGPALNGITESVDIPGVRLPPSLITAAEVLMTTPLEVRRVRG